MDRFFVLTALCLVSAAAVAQPGGHAAHRPGEGGQPPKWIEGAVLYQLDPERFANGDLTNDPTQASLRPPGSARAVRPESTDGSVGRFRKEASGFAIPNPGGVRYRHGGDLQGVIDRMDSLDSLGVTAIYLAPLFYTLGVPAYGAAAYRHVDPYLGPDLEGDLAQIAREATGSSTWQFTAADSLFLDLVEKLHTRGMRVVIDGVFRGAAQSIPPKPEVRAPLVAVTRRWMDPNGDGDPSDGIDGWRVSAVGERSPDFWSDWNDLVGRLNPEALTVAAARTEASGCYLVDTGFHMVASSHAAAVRTALIDHGMTLSALVDTLTARWACAVASTRVTSFHPLGSHDLGCDASVIVSRDDYSAVGRGSSPQQNDRPQENVSTPSVQKRITQRLLLTIQMTMPGVPIISYSHKAGTGDPAGPEISDDALFDAAREIVALYRRSNALQRGDMEWLDIGEHTLAFRRALPDDTLVVMVNRSGEAHLVELPGGRYRPLVPIFASHGDVDDIPALVAVLEESAPSRMGYRVPPRTAVVYRPASPSGVRSRYPDE